jgi:hypothetical protein
MNPSAYGVSLLPLPAGGFAQNDVGFVDPTGTDHDLLGRGLKKAIYNYMHGVGLDEDVRSWFDLAKCPKPQVKKNAIALALG